MTEAQDEGRQLVVAKMLLLEASSSMLAKTTRRALSVADLYDRECGIVRVDTRSDETVERVARAIAGNQGFDGGLYDTTDHTHYEATARAVLSSLLTEVET